MLLLQIEGSDAFFERQKGFVDLCTVQTSLTILINRICTALATRQVNEAHLAHMLRRLRVRPQAQLQDRVGATRVRVGASNATSTLLETQGHDLHDLLDSTHSTLSQADNIDLLLAILSAVEEHALVEQVVELAAVDFVEADLQEVVRIVAEQIDDIEGCQ